MAKLEKIKIRSKKTASSSFLFSPVAKSLKKRPEM